MFLVAIVVAYIGIKFLFSRFIPFWDGGVYYYWCLAPAVNAPFNLFHFNCAGHPAFMYVILVALLQYLSRGNIFLLHLPITLLGVCSIIAFFKIVRFLFPSENMKNEACLITAVYAFYPIQIATSLNFNLDYGTLVFYLIFLAFLLYKKYSLAVLSGLFLVFTKEPAVPMFVTTIGVYWFLELKRKKNKQLIAFLLSPFFIYVAYVGFTRIFFHRSALWADFGMKRAAEILFIPSVGNPIFLQYLIGIFLFNFNWIFTGTICVALIVFVIKKRTLTKEKGLLFLSLTFLINLYIVTSFKTFLNLRYYLPLYPTLILFFFASLISLISSQKIRTIILSVLLSLILISNIASIDPVTRLLFGRVQFGKQQLYKVGGMDDGVHLGVDGLVYNLQFTAFHYLLNEIYTDIKPQSATPFVFFDDVGDWNLTGWINNKTFAKSARFDSSFKAKSYTIPQFLHLSPPPPVAYYIDSPIVRADVKKTPLMQIYAITSEKTYSYFGYSIKVFTLTLKSTEL